LLEFYSPTLPSSPNPKKKAQTKRKHGDKILAEICTYNSSSVISSSGFGTNFSLTNLYQNFFEISKLAKYKITELK
jgi:hypothetical protein